MATRPISNDVDFEPISLVWLDASAKKSKESIEIIRRFRLIIANVQIFETIIDCLQYIDQKTIHDRLIIIVSGRLGQEIVPQIHHYRQILAILVYCMNKKLNEEWSKYFPKIKDVINKSDKLFCQIQSIQSKYFQTKIHEPLIINLSQFSTSSDRSLKTLDDDFLHWQLLIDCLLRMKTDSTVQQQLITFCKEHYRHNSNELNIIKEFEQNYTGQHALWWYTRESCFYRLLNKALCIENIDLLYLFSFFLGDLAKQIRQNQCSTSVCIYHGQMMSIDEINQLKNSCGEYISINTFFSTSLNRRKTLKFLIDEIHSNDLQKVLFEINADPISNQEKTFANIKSFSYYSYEEEILFLIGSIFRLINIRQEKSGLWIIHMIFSNTQDKNFYNLSNTIKQQCDQNNNETNLLILGNILYQMGKYDLAKKYFHLCQNNLSNNPEILLRCYHAQSAMALIHNDYDLSLQFHEKIIQMLIPNDLRLAETYNCIGCIYQRKQDSKHALEYYQRALNIWIRQIGDEHYQIADCLNNIGCLYEIEKNYNQALECHQKALNIRKKCLSENHFDLGGSYNNIGNIYFYMEKYDLALENYKYSYEIKCKSLPNEHLSIVTTLENLALIYEKINQLDQALICYQKAADILQRIFPSTHDNVIEIQRKIDETSSLSNSIIISTKF